MSLIALKIDVDTYRGTREGAQRLADLLERLDVHATFLFSLGPDHTGRAIKRMFRPGFFRKVQRTSVLAHYGLKTLLYGVLLPGPHIGRRCRAEMRGIGRRGFETGVHTWDHVRWQDHVAQQSEEWTRHELRLARQQYLEVFGEPPRVHGAAGWQMNAYLPGLEREMGFQYASDTRGTAPFVPVSATPGAVPQLPTTLPTLDELIGRRDLNGADPVGHLLALTDARAARDEVFTLHAELEGGRYLADFERLLREWRARGRRLADIGSYAGQLDFARLPHERVVDGSVPGRSGLLATQETVHA